MNKSETASILKMLMTTYPNTKIKEPEVLINTWVSSLGKYPVEVVKIAAEFHTESSAFFPTISEIMNMIPRAETLRQFEETNRPKPIDEKQAAKTKAEIETVMSDIIDFETELYGDFLDYER